MLCVKTFSTAFLSTSLSVCDSEGRSAWWTCSSLLEALPSFLSSSGICDAKLKPSSFTPFDRCRLCPKVTISNVPCHTCFADLLEGILFSNWRNSDHKPGVAMTTMETTPSRPAQATPVACKSESLKT